MSQQYQIGSYRETYRSFKLEVPERYNWAYEVFDHWARDPRRVAMVWAGDDGSTREVTFREMSEGSSRIANALAGIGARPGDKVLTMLPRVVEWWELVLGCMRAAARSSARDDPPDRERPDLPDQRLRVVHRSHRSRERRQD